MALQVITRIRLLHLVRLIATICVVVIAVLSLVPKQHLQRTELGGHLEHVIAYAGTAALLAIGYCRASLLALFVAYAGVLEYAQRFSLGRTSQIDDFKFSLLGIALGAAAGWALRYLTRRAWAR